MFLIYGNKDKLLTTTELDAKLNEDRIGLVFYTLARFVEYKTAFSSFNPNNAKGLFSFMSSEDNCESHIAFRNDYFSIELTIIFTENSLITPTILAQINLINKTTVACEVFNCTIKTFNCGSTYNPNYKESFIFNIDELFRRLNLINTYNKEVYINCFREGSWIGHIGSYISHIYSAYLDLVKTSFKPLDDFEWERDFFNHTQELKKGI